jgi:hypothetical protein
MKRERGGESEREGERGREREIRVPSFVLCVFNNSIFVFPVYIYIY